MPIILDEAITTDISTANATEIFATTIVGTKTVIAFLNPYFDVAIVCSLNVVTELGLHQYVTANINLEYNDIFTTGEDRQVAIILNRGGGGIFHPAVSATIFQGSIYMKAPYWRHAATIGGVDSDAAITGVDSRTYHLRMCLPQVTAGDGEVTIINPNLAVINYRR